MRIVEVHADLPWRRGPLSHEAGDFGAKSSFNGRGAAAGSQNGRDGVVRNAQSAVDKLRSRPIMRCMETPKNSWLWLYFQSEIDCAWFRCRLVDRVVWPTQSRIESAKGKAHRMS